MSARLPTFVAEVHTFRLEPRTWPRIFDAVCELGFDGISLPVPWEFHQPTQAPCKWQEHLNLAAAMDLAADRGLAVILRPGPRLGRELTGSGFPDWILGDRSLWAQTTAGHPASWPLTPRMHAIPDYQAPVFRHHVEEWFAMVAAAVGQRALAALVLDHELAAFHRTDLDWDLPAIAHWLRAAATGAGLSAPSFLSVPNQPTALSTPLAGAVAPSVYGLSGDAPALKARLTATLSPAHPRFVDITCGGSPFAFPRAPEDDLAYLAAAIAAGVSTLCVSCVAERDRHYGAWIDGDGTITHHGRRMGDVLIALRDAGVPLLREAISWLVVDPTADDRAAIATSDLPSLPPFLTTLAHLRPSDVGSFHGDGDDTSNIPPAAETFETVLCALRSKQIPYRVIGEHRRELDDDADGIIVPVAHRIHAGLWERLQNETRPVILGPGRPRRDEHGAPLGDLRLPKRTGVIAASADANTIAADLANLSLESKAQGGPKRLPLTVANDDSNVDSAAIETTVLRDEDDRPRVIIVANHGETIVTASLAGGDESKFFDARNGMALVRDEHGGTTLSVRPRQILLLVHMNI